jgi:Mrp family chromosome partitioning ATPase
MMRDMQQNLRSQLELQVKGQARSSNGSGPRTTRAVAITSPSRNDGTSAVAAGLAHAILRAGGTCSVLDLDVISTGVTKRLETAEVFREPGDSNAGETGFSRSSVDVPGLELLTLAGSEVEVEASLAQADGLVELGRVASDWIVVDTPPLPAAVEVLPALKAVDAVVIVVRLRSTSRSEVVRLHEILDLVGIEALGYVVLGAGGPRRRRSAPRPRPRSRAPQSVG